ncbi:hypothetical protein GOBAR_AA02001 [Gossypium barbadense]|uniref:FAD-binding domain-containing protein n=1 Tax=Gossypium barbadense TaxID=3634 RepID=A0A2P5YSR1_GOSBA|nr:hypothetical protein GOBAR_AA02001 [Gossypium barbadense]
MARMAAIMALTYKAYLGVGLGPLSISHPGRVGGRFFIDLAIPVQCIFGTQGVHRFLGYWCWKDAVLCISQGTAGGVDINGKKERLLQIFNGRCNNVIDLLLATDEDMLIRRDIYDRTPSLTWGRGRVTLLGDFIHAMQPNMGQGGCMAIEDSYQLALELSKAWKQSVESGTAIDIVSSLRFLKKFPIPHPGRVGGRFFIDLAIPLMLSWVLGGNS